VTSFVDGTTVVVLSVFGWSDLKEENPTHRHVEEKELIAVIVTKNCKWRNSYGVVAHI
jgi:hypothetical protein